MTTLSNTHTAQTPLVRALQGSGLLAEDLDYHIVRTSMVIMFFFFGYEKWFPYKFERLVPFISNGPLIWWLYPVFGHAGASYFLGVSEWTFGALLLAGFWSHRLGVSERWARQAPSSRPLPSFPSCRRVGTSPQEASRR
ncbi:DUF417 family protein [Bradyrhizobium sp. BRP22]|uniref:DUF417 family protein n=1 Tax=Bradyrhizobium sp. BRP22 TaxID=2793821 RepID=UPI001CD52BD9